MAGRGSPCSHGQLSRIPFHLPDMGQLLQKHLTGLGDAIVGAAKPLFRFQEEITQRAVSAAAGPTWNQWSPRPKSRYNPSFMPCFASLSSSPPCSEDAGESRHLFDVALSQEQVSKTLEGVPVYTVSNSGNEFVLVSDPEGSKSLSLLCFRQQDAEALLTQVRDREPVLGREARVVSVPLEKVYKLSAEGIAFRFLPDPVQVKNAIETKVKSGDKTKAFDGVPVFQKSMQRYLLSSSSMLWRAKIYPFFFKLCYGEAIAAKCLIIYKK
ncbi:hypothetical protein GOP47_0030686 [Adiantum capillus-veneris]|nr:hypothetical protein GOP47_0030686 [Adiantum capillus-veneris]